MAAAASSAASGSPASACNAASVSSSVSRFATALRARACDASKERRAMPVALSDSPMSLSSLATTSNCALTASSASRAARPFSVLLETPLPARSARSAAPSAAAIAARACRRTCQPPNSDL